MKRGRALKQLSAIFLRGLPKSPDWSAVLSLANEQLITPELSDSLERSGEIALLPEEVAAFLEDVAKRNRERNLRLSSTLGEVIGACNSAGVVPVLLKGCAVLAHAAPARNRIVGDIDLLVRPAEMTATIESLVKLGFCVLQDRRAEHFHQSVELSRPRDVGSIDLHQHSPGPAKLALGIDVHADSRIKRFLGATALLPSPEMQILIAVLHDQFQDGHFWRGGFDFRHLLDIASLAEAREGVCWDHLRSLCPTSSVRLALEAQLYAVRQIFGGAIPASVSKAGLHYQRQRLQYVWPVLNAVFHHAGLNRTAWQFLSSRLASPDRMLRE